MKDFFEQISATENSKMVVVTLLALVLIPLLSWIAFFRRTKRQPFLNPDVWQELPLVGKEVITHNTRRFRCDQGVRGAFQQSQRGTLKLASGLRWFLCIPGSRCLTKINQ